MRGLSVLKHCAVKALVLLSHFPAGTWFWCGRSYVSALVNGPHRIPEKSLVHHVEAFVNEANSLMDGRKGFSVSGVLTGWFSAGAPLNEYDVNTVALVVGTNNYFAGTLMKLFLSSGPPSRNLFHTIANKRTQQVVDDIRRSILSQVFEAIPHGFKDISLGTITRSDLVWYWINPLNLNFLPWDNPPLHVDPSSQNVLLQNVDKNAFGNEAGITQLLDPSTSNALWKTELEKRFRTAVADIASASAPSTDDVPSLKSIPTKLPSESFHYLYGGWYDLRGVLVLRGLQEPQSSKPPKSESSLHIPRPTPLSVANFLPQRVVDDKLLDALSEFVNTLRGSYLGLGHDDKRSKPLPLMKWKDITEAERLVASHYNSHWMQKASQQKSSEPAQYNRPATVPVPPASYLLYCDPILFFRLTQFGNAYNRIMSDTPFDETFKWADVSRLGVGLRSVSIAMFVVLVVTMALYIWSWLRRVEKNRSVPRPCQGGASTPSLAMQDSRATTTKSFAGGKNHSCKGADELKVYGTGDNPIMIGRATFMPG